MKRVIDIYYERYASENEMNRVFNPRTGKRGHALRREAKAWRDKLIELVSEYKGEFGPDVSVTLQIISNGKARGDTQNFVKLGLDSIASGLGLVSDTHFNLVVSPRERGPVEQSILRVTLE